MKEQHKIPTSKVKRASRFVRTGVKVGGNYMKHYAKKAVGANVTKEDLDKENADDIYKTLSELKGSALKVAQVLSMEKNLLPSAYTDAFAMAQHKAPPLSGPLVVKTFKQYVGKSPQQIFDTFDMQASHAASIGQVHEASKNGQKLAVKIQYPGVAESVKSDLRMVKPFALRLLGLSEADLDQYFEEVENKLLEETNYDFELEQSQDFSSKCKHLPNLAFAEYYPEMSSNRILTMSWLDGLTLGEWVQTNPSQELRNKVGQSLWDFYMYQAHELKFLHSDPHPGNFLIQEDGTVGVIDFGCTKKIPTHFYDSYFALADAAVIDNEEERYKHFITLEMLHEDDTQADKDFFLPLFVRGVKLMAKPLYSDTFDFSDNDFFQKIYSFGDELARMPEVRKSSRPRGSKHALYVQRTIAGLFNLLNQLQAKIYTRWSVDD